ncbi:hypothetical protein [Kineococcus gypseus]|uniref:hypothetical protein n=1 Tax=Kineococcus gypseus TaxID=1637102 RepID=UPI003D7C44EE
MTLVTAVVVLFGVLNARGYGLALALGGATPIGAAAVAGAVAVPTFYAVAIGAAAGVALRVLQRARWAPGAVVAPVPGVRPLVLLCVVAVLVTLLAPMLFDGLPVLSPAGGDVRLAAGVLTKSNIAQITYLVLSVCVVVFLARSRWAGPQVVGTAALLATLLSLWAWAGGYGMPYPRGVFDNSPGFTIQETLPGGLPRVRGIFSEPAGLAGSSLITVAYAASRSLAVGGLHRLGLLLVAGVALFLGAISTSATFFVAGAALAVIAVAAGAARFLLRRGPLSGAAVALVCAATIAALWVLPWLTNLVGAVVDDKVDSASYTERSGADDYSFGLVVDTFGLGVGVGSNRASSFAASLLSTVGVLGTALLVAAVWVLVRETAHVRAVRPVTWALVALLLTKVVSGPDLADTNGILWMGLGVLAHAALSSPRAGAHPSAARDPEGSRGRPRAGAEGRSTP